MNTKFKYDFYRRFGTLPKPVSNFDNAPIDPIKTLSDAFNMEPEAAVRYFESKGYKITWDWKSIAAAAHNQAFTVAKVMQADLLQFFKNEITKAIKNGTTFEEFKKNVDIRLSESGWKGKQPITDPVTGKVSNVDLSSPSRLKNIYRTNLQSSYMSGRYEQMRETTKSHPYGIYRNGDPKSEICQAVKGQVVSLSDPNLRVPPLHFGGCKTTIDPISKREAIRSGYVVVDAAKIYKEGGGVQSAFDTHPEERWKPDTNKYDPDIEAQLNKALQSGKDKP